MGYEAFAQSIADDNYMFSIAEKLGPMAAAIGTRDQVRLQNLITKISDRATTTSYEIPTAYDVALEFAETVGLDNQMHKTGITPYDNAIGGLAVNTLNLIAARPSVGKTALAWQIARNMAAAGKKVIYFGLEMSATALWARAACGATELSLKDHYNNNFDDNTILKLIDVSATLMNNYGENLLIDDRSKLSSADIWKAVAKYQPNIIIVDHISLLSDKAENEIKRLGNITWEGKQIAKEYNLVSIYLQQLNRGVENRTEKRPTMSDLRDSGETEQNADTITFIYRADYYKVGQPPLVSDTELIIAKNRDGDRNIVASVRYHLKRQWFYSRAELDADIEARRIGK
jgi:replicative DNA helicase